MDCRAGLFDSLATFDLPYNQAPSLHIALAIIVGAFYWTRFPKIRLPLFLWQSLIALSVLTTYQHHFIDVPTGALLGWLVLWAFPRQMASPLKLGLSHARSQKIALLYLLGACLMVLPALLGGAWLWLIWISVSLLMVAFAYLTGNVAFFQKQANGKLSAAATVLLLPYLVGVRLNMAYWLRSKAKTAPVRHDVWIGSVLGIPPPPNIACGIGWYAPNIPAVAIRENIALCLYWIWQRRLKTIWFRRPRYWKPCAKNTAKCWYVALWVMEEVPQWC